MSAQPPHSEASDVHFTLKGYLTGFALAALLTILPFALVMSHAISDSGIAMAAVLALAVTQICVHSAFFLHVNAKTEGGWSLIAYLFTAVIILITIGGSIWIMLHLNANMMPGAMVEHPGM